MKRPSPAIIAIAICLFPNTNINAQRIIFSSELGYFITDDNISAISPIWESCINAIDTGSDCLHFWIEGSCDIHIGLHEDGLLNTYNIRKLSDDIYEKIRLPIIQIVQ